MTGSPADEMSDIPRDARGPPRIPTLRLILPITNRETGGEMKSESVAGDVYDEDQK
jgi:hypothetical protein